MSCTLELDATGVGRAALARALGGRLGRPAKLAMLWHDNGDAGLAARGLALSERRESRGTLWQLAPLHPAPGAGSPIAEAAEMHSLGHALPAALLPVAAFAGTRRRVARDEVDIVLVQGELRGLAGTAPLQRLQLRGTAAAVVALARHLAGADGVRVPPDSIARAAMQAAGRLGAAPHKVAGAAGLSAGLSIGEAFALLCAGLAGTLLGRGAQIAAIQIAGGAVVPRDPEPVHQMRVALRRLRSALALFAPALPCPDMAAARSGLKALAAALGPARDWDVFVAETASGIAAGFPDEPAMARLLGAAERRRSAAHAALRAHLGSADDRRLGVALASLASFSPWNAAPPIRRPMGLRAHPPMPPRPSRPKPWWPSPAGRCHARGTGCSPPVRPSTPCPRTICTPSGCAPNGCAMPPRCSPRFIRAVTPPASCAGWRPCRRPSAG